MRTAAHPGLYDPAAQTPSLAGSRCDACSRTAFPPVQEVRGPDHAVRCVRSAELPPYRPPT